MTAVAPPPNFQNLSRSTWSSGNGSSNGINSMSADDVSRMLMPPRKTATRSNSSSSVSSLASTSSTGSTSSPNSTSTAVPAPTTNGDNASRKRPSSRYLWPMSKSEPVAGISTARTQPVASTSGPSATSAMTALHHMPVSVPLQASPALSQHVQDSRQTGRVQLNENTPVLFLTPMNGTFERKTIQVPFYPDVIRIGRQTNAKTIPTPTNGYFDSKVLSRQHAEVWSDRNGKIWIRDIKSSNGTFVNGQRLSGENKDSDPHELREQDMLELGIDIVSEDQKTVVHHKVAARVEHSGFVNNLDSFVLGSDTSDLTAHLTNQFGQGPGHLRRNSTPSGYNNGLRGGIGAPNNLALQRPQGFLLGPVNMEQVIKKLNAEYRLARQQSMDLQRSQQFLDSVLNSNQPQKESTTTALNPESSKGKSAAKDLKARFMDPPNPPPQTPLPEKPQDVPSSSFLRRSDTERPKAANGSLPGSSKSDSTAASQITNLSEALITAKKDLEDKNKNLRDLQDLLVKERVRREAAEARADKLEKEQRPLPTLRTESANGIVVMPRGMEEAVTTPIEEESNSEIGHKKRAPSLVDESATAKLQQRMDLLLTELREAKESSERWKHEKEQAERERDQERQEKLSLMDMIEAQRTAERERTDKKSRSRGFGRWRKNSDGKRDAATLADNGTESSAADVDTASNDISDNDAITTRTDSNLTPSPGSPRNLSFSMNGHAERSLLQQADGKPAVIHLDTLRLVQAAPYLSAMSVVLIGVAVMALVNKISGNER